MRRQRMCRQPMRRQARMLLPVALFPLSLFPVSLFPVSFAFAPLLLAPLLGAALLVAPMAGGTASAEDRPVAQVDNAAGTVASAQEALARLGYPVGPIDGILGPRTREATRRFQQDLGLARTATFDQETLDALGLAAAPRLSARDQRRPDAGLSAPEQMPVGQREPIAGQPGAERPDARRPGLTRPEIGGVAPGRFQSGEGIAPGRFERGGDGSRPGARSDSPRPGLGD
jgi:hypothetical protein